MRNSCRVSPSSLKEVVPKPRPRCSAPAAATSQFDTHWGPLQVDVSATELIKRLKNSGFSETKEVVRPYAVTTVKMEGQKYKQEGSAPNFEGGLGTLCTCKHQMRSRYTADEWISGVWVLGLTSKSLWKPGQQTFYYLMRVRWAYESQAELVAGLTEMGRQDVISAKNATVHELGDVFRPRLLGLTGKNRFIPNNYVSPIAGHAHSQDNDPLHWHNDIWYEKAVRPPPLLIGDPAFTFVWTRPIVKRKNPSDVRDYRNWTLAHLIDEITGAE